MKKQMLIASCALVLMASPLAAQTGSGSGSGSSSGSSSQTTSKDGKTTTTVKTEEPQPGTRFVRSLTNVQVEFTLTDQVGGQAPEKKTVSMIVSSGNMGKIRSAATVQVPPEPPFVVDLNVDARPLVSTDGLIQLEMTLVYSPPISNKAAVRERPTGMNQSLTVVLQNGKPLVVSQAADPVSDRKVIVEVKASILK